MGKPTGFLETPRETHPYRPVAKPVGDFREVFETLPILKVCRAGGPLHGLRRPVLPPGLPARQPDPRLERPGLSRPVEDRHRAAPRDQQLPRVHRQALPRALRDRLRPRPDRRARRHQADRGVDHRPGLGRRVDRPPAAEDPGPARGSPSSAPAPPASPPRSSSPGPATTSSVFERDDRIGGLLRYGIPDFKMEKHHIDRRLDQMEAEGVVFQPGRERRRGRHGRPPPRRVRRRLPLRRGDPAPRPPDPRPRARRHPLRDGLPHPAEQAGRRRLDPRRPLHHGEGQGRHHHWRRRHRGRLPGDGPPPGGPDGSPGPDQPRASRRAGPDNPWPQWANIFRTGAPTRKEASASSPCTPAGSSARAAR